MELSGELYAPVRDVHSRMSCHRNDMNDQLHAPAIFLSQYVHWARSYVGNARVVVDVRSEQIF